MTGRWFRFYEDWLNDPDIQMLSDKKYRKWFEDYRSMAPKFQDRPPLKIWRMIRERIFKRDDYTCKYCGARGVKLECDHVLPVSRGGNHADINLVTACRPCNQSKRNKTPEEWRAA